MKYPKTMIIDGPHTIFSSEYFMKDNTPRVLARFVDEGYKIWMLINQPSDYDVVENGQMPNWLRNYIETINESGLNNLKNLDFDKRSFIVTNDKKKAQSYDTKLDICLFEEIFNKDPLKHIDVVDLIVCFGFPDEEFKMFCKRFSVMGVMNNKIINNGYNGVAIMMEGEDMMEDVSIAVDNFKEVVEKNLYTVKHDNNLMAVTYKGRGINVELGSLNGIIPLLYY